MLSPGVYCCLMTHDNNSQALFLLFFPVLILRGAINRPLITCHDNTVENTVTKVHCNELRAMTFGDTGKIDMVLLFEMVQLCV